MFELLELRQQLLARAAADTISANRRDFRGKAAELLCVDLRVLVIVDNHMRFDATIAQ